MKGREEKEMAREREETTGRKRNGRKRIEGKGKED